MEKITILLERRGMRQADLSRATGIRESRLTQLGQSDGKLRVPEALKIARALGVPLDFLADDEMTEPPESLSADDQTLLRITRGLGYDEALKRLLRAPGEHRVSYNEPPGNASPSTGLKRGAG